MGSLEYGTPPSRVEIDDRTLAHLQIVITSKFRRDERFTLTLDAEAERGRGRLAVWLHPTIPLQFSYAGSRQPAINPAWLEALMARANTGNLVIVPEPEPASDTEPLRRTA
jgi:hypothetical protein